MLFRRDGFGVISSWVVAWCFLLSACGPRASEPEITSAPLQEKAAAASKFLDPTTTGTIKGKVFFEGTSPALVDLPIRGNPECAVFHPSGAIRSEELLVENGLLRNVFVYVKQGLEGHAFQVPPSPVTVENKRCVYVPHVVGVQAGQPLLLINDDPTLHNVHLYSKSNRAFNLGLPFQGMKQTKKFDAPEVMMTLKCDVHPWMLGYVGVLPHPFFAVTGMDGTFELKGLPPGEYVLEAWHEKLGPQTLTVNVGPQETKDIEFRF